MKREGGAPFNPIPPSDDFADDADAASNAKPEEAVASDTGTQDRASSALDPTAMYRVSGPFFSHVLSPISERDSSDTGSSSPRVPTYDFNFTDDHDRSVESTPFQSVQTTRHQPPQTTDDQTAKTTDDQTAKTTDNQSADVLSLQSNSPSTDDMSLRSVWGSCERSSIDSPLEQERSAVGTLDNIPNIADDKERSASVDTLDNVPNIVDDAPVLPLQQPLVVVQFATPEEGPVPPELQITPPEVAPRVPRQPEELPLIMVTGATSSDEQSGELGAPPEAVPEVWFGPPPQHTSLPCDFLEDSSLQSSTRDVLPVPSSSLSKPVAMDISVVSTDKPELPRIVVVHSPNESEQAEFQLRPAEIPERSITPPDSMDIGESSNEKSEHITNGSKTGKPILVDTSSKSGIKLKQSTSIGSTIKSVLQRISPKKTERSPPKPSLMDTSDESGKNLEESASSDFIKKAALLRVRPLTAESSPPHSSPMDVCEDSAAAVCKSPKRSPSRLPPYQISQHGGHKNVESLKHATANESMTSLLTHPSTSEKPPHSLKPASPARRASSPAAPGQTSQNVQSEMLQVVKKVISSLTHPKSSRSPSPARASSPTPPVQASQNVESEIVQAVKKVISSLTHPQSSRSPSPAKRESSPTPPVQTSQNLQSEIVQAVKKVVTSLTHPQSSASPPCPSLVQISQDVLPEDLESQEHSSANKSDTSPVSHPPPSFPTAAPSTLPAPTPSVKILRTAGSETSQTSKQSSPSKSVTTGVRRPLTLSSPRRTSSHVGNENLEPSERSAAGSSLPQQPPEQGRDENLATTEHSTPGSSAASRPSAQLSLSTGEENMETSRDSSTSPSSPPASQRRRINKSPDDKRCLLYTSPSPRDRTRSRMPSSA